MIKIYGSPMCPGCVKCKEELEKAGVPFLYLSITDNLLNLKQFLKLRESHQEFDPIRERGQIGIPCVVDEEGNLTFEWTKYLK